jgi:PKD repeat protein
MYAQGQGAVRKSLFTYRHPYDATGRDLGASVTGLAFYTGTGYPDRHRGALFFADYAQRFIRYLTFDSAGNATAHNFATEVGSNLGAVELLIGPDENLYAVYIDLKTRTSQVRRFRSKSAGNSPPIVKASVNPLRGDAPLRVTVNASQSVDPDGQELSFMWDFGDGEMGPFADGSHEYTKPGIYNATVTVTERTSPFLKSSESVVIRVAVPENLAVIDAPAPGTLYEIGQAIAFSGHAEGMPDTDVSYTWSVLQIHNDHTHLVTEIDGKSGEFVPTEHTDNTSHELCLFVNGGEGLSDVQCVRLIGKTSPYTFTSQPVGAPIVYLDEEKEVSAPYLAHPIVGSRQSITATRIFAGRSFVGWSDGEKNTARTFLTGLAPRTFTAVYKNLPPKGLLTRMASSQSKSTRKREIRLDASGSQDPEGEALKFDWRFSDGQRFRSATVRKRFVRDGRYTLRLTVRDPLGGRQRLWSGLTVRGANPVKLTRR